MTDDSLDAGEIPGTPDGPRSPLVVALTGGIASGKTAVSDAFAARGVPVVDTDVIARELVEPGRPALAEIRERFGEEVIGGEGRLDRRALRKRIFDDAGARADLEAILHPRIVEEARRRIAAERAPYVLLVVPLLVETGLFSDASRVLVVDVPEELQRERLMQRDGVDARQADAALDAQATRQERLDLADDVLDNTGTLADLAERVAELDRDYRARAARRKAGDPESS